MLRQMRHDVWATARLIEHCRSLSDEQLDGLTAAGTYGSIRRTIEHIVGADIRYLRRLDVVVVDPPFREDHDVPLDEIASLCAKIAEAIERLFPAVERDPDAIVADALSQRPAGAPPRTVEAWTMLAQFVHHGSDHRAHIGTILGANGLPTPQLDVWRYGSEIGAITERR